MDRTSVCCALTEAQEEWPYSKRAPEKQNCEAFMPTLGMATCCGGEPTNTATAFT